MRALACRHQVTVITSELFRPEIELAGGIPGVAFRFVRRGWPLFGVRGPGAVGGRLTEWLRYYRWQWRAYRLARELHAEARFDLVLHVTLGTWRVPSLMGGLRIPFILSALGGGQSVPSGFGRTLGGRGMIYEALREMSQRLVLLDPLVQRTWCQAAMLLVSNRATLRRLPGPVRSKARLLLPFRISVPAERPMAEVRSQPIPFKLLWIGQLVPLKGLPLLLKALARLDGRVQCRLTVIGDGSEMGRWRRLCIRLGLAERVEFCGRRSHEETQRSYLEHDLFVFTSLRDSGGQVLLEAMACGLPVVCLDWAGPADVVADGAGVKIAVQSEAQVEADLARAIESLAGDRERRYRLAMEGKRWVTAGLSWDAWLTEMEPIIDAAGCGGVRT